MPRYLIVDSSLEWGLGVLPFEDPKKIFYVHQILLPMNGIYILENVNAEEAVKDRVYEGLFTLGPPRVTGSAGDHQPDPAVLIGRREH